MECIQGGRFVMTIRTTSRERLAVAVAASLVLVLAAAMIVSPASGAKKRGGKPDLKAKKVSGVPKQAGDGDAATVKVKVKNGGSAKARKSKVSLYLSSDKRKSKGDKKLPGKKGLPTLKPGKSANVKVKTKLNGDDGGWYVIACASKAKREKKTGNNCQASRKLTIGSTGAGPWPERYMGSFSVSFSLSQETQNAEKGQAGTEDFNGSMDGEMVLTRLPGDLLGGTDQPWHYESSGSLDWSGSYTSAFQSSFYSETCSGQGSGIEPVNPFAGVTTQRYGWVRPDGDLSPGASYTTFGDEDSNLEYAGTCNSSEGGGPVNGDRFPVFPAILPRDFDDDCQLKGGSYNVKPDGSLAGTDSCRFDYDFIHPNSGTHFVGTNTANWSWDLTPTG
jgi:hypothetical protein